MIFAPVLSTVKTILVRGVLCTHGTWAHRDSGVCWKRKGHQGPFYDRLWGHAGDRGRVQAARFTMGIMDLQSGIYFVTLVMGLFALPEALFLVLDERRSKAMANTNKIEYLRISREEAREITPVVARQYLGSSWGFYQAGATMASFLGYGVERNLAPAGEREKFESFVDWRLQKQRKTGSFVPMLTLGIPGSGTTR